MNLNTLFKNNKERKEAISHLKTLAMNPDWKFLVKQIIQSDIDQISEEILNTTFDDLSKENEMKRRRAYWIILSQLPDKLAEALEENKEDIMEFDPYVRDIKELESRAGSQKK